MRKKRRDMELQTFFISTSFFFFFLLSTIPSLVYSQSDSCSSNLNLGSFVPFDTTSFHCDLVWGTENFILRYLQSGPNVWSFVLSAPFTDSYMAMGFSKNGNMVGSSAIVGWGSVDDGSGMVKQYFLGGFSSSQVMPDQGKLSVVQNSTAVVYRSGVIYMAFQLNLTEPGSRVIYAVGPRNWLPGSDFRLQHHRNQISTSFNYVTGQSTKENPHTRLRRGHGVLNMMSWGILTIIGSIIARYFRHWDSWYKLHACIQSSAFVLGFIGVILGLVLEDRLDANVSRHKGIGIFIFVLGCLQVMAFLIRPHHTSKVRRYWNWYHYSIGRTLIAFAIGNVFYGISLGNEGGSWNAGYGVVFAILFLFTIVLEVKMRMKK